MMASKKPATSDVADGITKDHPLIVGVEQGYIGVHPGDPGHTMPAGAETVLESQVPATPEGD